MPRRDRGSKRIRRLVLAAVLGASLAASIGFSAQAAGDDGAVQPGPGASPTSGTDPGTTPAAGDPAPAPPDPSVAKPGAATVASPPPVSSSASSSPDPRPSVAVALATASASKTVSIVDFSFNPGGITVHAGDTVQWTNNGQVPEGHDVTGDGLQSGVLHAGGSYSHTFSSAGTFSYICSIHPTMHGTVTVLARSSGGSGGSNGSSGNGSGSSGSGGGSSNAAPTGAGSESAAVSSPGAAGSASSLPSTGSDMLRLATLGLVLLSFGLAVRLVESGRARRR